MTDYHHTRTRTAVLRKLRCLLVVASVVAGTTCVGTGFGTAMPGDVPGAVTVSAGAPGTAPGSAGDKNWWSLYNYTGQSIYGEWSVQTGKNVSEVKLVEDWPLPFGDHESRARNESKWWKSYWMGHICRNHAWWNFPRTEIVLADDAAFTLWYKNGLQVGWNPWKTGAPATASLILNLADGPC
ncbi:hypothetical protein R3Q06_32880 [Rhodococcus erythropolis]|uniref:hypothetical protein n=1 Tax=Rhodococcus erythropolis TaxID=1833 RepID=UPI00294A64F3|nr:hypothetical protein [Rhodococcus erythropolis]MDV6278260.1 hypothetical protein [Rhodococcus erythropolis]